MDDTFQSESSFQWVVCGDSSHSVASVVDSQAVEVSDDITTSLSKHGNRLSFNVSDGDIIKRHIRCVSVFCQNGNRCLIASQTRDRYIGEALSHVTCISTNLNRCIQVHVIETDVDDHAIRVHSNQFAFFIITEVDVV